jgi:hypothetical protein
MVKVGLKVKGDKYLEMKEVLYIDVYVKYDRLSLFLY